MENTGFGTFQARIFTASSALPLENAVIKIVGSGEYNSDIQHSLLTNDDGLTDEISLPATSKELSMSPGAVELPYSVYDVEIIKEGFYPKKISNIPIFDSTKALLPIEMIPVSYLPDGEISPRNNLDSTIYENENLT